MPPFGIISYSITFMTFRCPFYDFPPVRTLLHWVCRVASRKRLRDTYRGTMRPPVAIAMSSISGPPTHRTAGRSFFSNKWFASSSNPHWQMTRLAPVSLTYSKKSALNTNAQCVCQLLSCAYSLTANCHVCPLLGKRCGYY